MTAMDDAFGNIPDRPDHPDFWKLASAALKLDGRMDAAAPDDRPQVFMDTVNERIDLESLVYFARQRILRANVPDVLQPLLTSVFMDAFMIFLEYSS